MSKANPRKAVAALLPLPLECPSAGGLAVRPMTLGMWAALERINSPLVTGKEAKDVLELLPSLYLLTHDPREVLRGDFFDAAVAWADTVPVSAMEEIQRACFRQMDAMFAVLPEIEKKKTKRETTGGSRSSLTGPHRNTGGASRKSCGASPSARSRSFGVRRNYVPAKSSRSLKSRK